MNKSRLIWSSRRGMLELDLFLVPFVEHYYDTLAEDDQLRYQRLLESEDQDLFLWFLERESPTDPDLKRIVQLVHDFRTRPGAV